MISVRIPYVLAFAMFSFSLSTHASDVFDSDASRKEEERLKIVCEKMSLLVRLNNRASWENIDAPLSGFLITKPLKEWTPDNFQYLRKEQDNCKERVKAKYFLFRKKYKDWKEVNHNIVVGVLNSAPKWIQEEKDRRQELANQQAEKKRLAEIEAKKERERAVKQERERRAKAEQQSFAKLEAEKRILAEEKAAIEHQRTALTREKEQQTQLANQAAAQKEQDEALQQEREALAKERERLKQERLALEKAQLERERALLEKERAAFEKRQMEQAPLEREMVTKTLKPSTTEEVDSPSASDEPVESTPSTGEQAPAAAVATTETELHVSIEKAEAPKDTFGEDCDRLAGDPYDAKKASTGVNQRDIDYEVAKSACESAVERYPNVPRYQHQLGRVLAKKDVKVAQKRLKSAAKMGYEASAVLYAVDEANLYIEEQRSNRFQYYLQGNDIKEFLGGLENASNKGYPIASLVLANIYRADTSNIENLKRAREYVQNAVDRGVEAAIPVREKIEKALAANKVESQKLVAKSNAMLINSNSRKQRMSSSSTHVDDRDTSVCNSVPVDPLESIVWDVIQQRGLTWYSILDFGDIDMAQAQRACGAAYVNSKNRSPELLYKYAKTHAFSLPDAKKALKESAAAGYYPAQVALTKMRFAPTCNPNANSLIGKFEVANDDVEMLEKMVKHGDEEAAYVLGCFLAYTGKTESEINRAISLFGREYPGWAKKDLRAKAHNKLEEIRVSLGAGDLEQKRKRIVEYHNRGSWVAVEGGCKMFGTHPLYSQLRLTWSGECQDGFITGEGMLSAFDKNKSFDNYKLWDKPVSRNNRMSALSGVIVVDMKPEDIVQSDVQCNENRGRSITLRQTTSVSFVLKKHIDIAFDDTIFELADRAFNLSKVRCGVNSNVVQEIYVTANNEGWDAKTTRISYQLNAKLVTDRFTGNRYNLVILDGKYVDSRLAYFKEESERALKQYRKQKQLEEQRKRQQQEAIVRKRLEENRKHYNSLRSARIGRNVHTIKEFKDLAKGNQAKFERETIGKEMGLLGRVLEIKNSSPEIAKKYGARDLVWVVLTHGEPMEELLARTRGMSQYHRQSTINSETNMSDKMFMYGVGAACAAVDSKNINRALELRKADLVQAYGTIAEIDRVDKPLIKPCEIRLLERAQQR